MEIKDTPFGACLSLFADNRHGECVFADDVRACGLVRQAYDREFGFGQLSLTQVARDDVKVVAVGDQVHEFFPRLKVERRAFPAFVE